MKITKTETKINSRAFKCWHHRHNKPSTSHMVPKGKKVIKITYSTPSGSMTKTLCVPESKIFVNTFKKMY